MKRAARFVRLLPSVLLLLALATFMAPVAVRAAAAAASTPSTARVEQGGVALSFEQAGNDNGSGVARLAISDARTGRAFEGARPAAWLLARRSEQVASESTCEDKAAMLSAGSLGQRADVDLNGYRLLTLNHDNTVAFINPLVRVGSTQLESIVVLPATGHDWVLAPDAQRLAVSLRDADAVALIDTTTRQLVATVPTGVGSRPTRLALDSDGHRLWVGLDGANAVMAIDLASAKPLGRATVGRGLHTLALPPDSAWLYVTNSENNNVSIVDRGTLKTVAEVPVPATPVAAVWSAAAQRVVVLSANGGQLALIDGAARRVSATVALARGALALGLFDEGRRALVLNGRTNSLALVDLAHARVVAERPLPERPDQIAFTREFAYVRSQSTATVQMIALAAAREGRLEGPAIPMGRRAPDEAADAINVADVMVPAPEGNGLLVANAGDGSVYRYAQGMMVPINSHSNYRRRARGLLVLDNSLVERSAGRFEANMRVPHAGRYDLVVRNLQPAITACAVVALDGPDAARADAAHARAKATSLKTRVVGQDQLQLEFTLAPPAGPNADADAHATAGGPVTVLLVQRQGAWQARAPAQPLGQGRFGARLRGLPPGEFEAMVEAPALQLGFSEGRLGRVAWPLAESR